jgi:DNA-binding CsgD family transcriptional regulator
MNMIFESGIPMHGSRTGVLPTDVRISILASPTLAADSIARSLSAAGWKIGRVASSLPDLQGFEHDLQLGDIVVAIDGGIPAAAVALELRRRKPGLRTVVISNEPGETDHNTVRVAPSTDFRDLLQTLERFGTAPIDESALTSRHLEILQLIASGMSTDEVGVKLGIAAKTVNNHLSAVYRRLRARNLTQAVLRAVRAGLIDINPV